MLFTSPRERRLWIQAVLWLALVYASLAFVRAPTEFLRERNLLRVTVAAVFITFAVWIVVRALKRRPGPHEMVTLGFFGAVYLVALLRIERHEERLHFVQYGVLGALVYSALIERRSNDPQTLLARWPAPVAILLTAICGWGDEGIQYLLPERVYELRDVGLNVMAGVLVVVAMGGLALARARDAAVGLPRRP